MSVKEKPASVQLGEAVGHFVKEFLGKGPTEVRTYLDEEMVTVRLGGLLTAAESRLARSSDGAALVKHTRMRLMETMKENLVEVAERILNRRISEVYSDMSTRTGERIIVFTFEKRNFAATN